MTAFEPQNTPERTPQENAKKQRFRDGLAWLWKKITANWGWKLFSLVAALVLWAVLITQDPTLTREKTFTDATVSLVGSENVKRNGFIVTSDLSEQLGGITLRVDVPQLQYSTARASNYNLRVDLSRITEAGEQELPLLTTNSTTYGTVVSVEPASVSATVEEYLTRYRIPVTVTTTGTVPTGWYATSATVDPPVVAISGPESTVSSVIRAEANLDLSILPQQEGTVRTSVPLTLIGTDGLPVSADLVEITNESVLADTVVLDQRVYPTKSLQLSDVGMVVGTPAEGYEIKSVTFSPTTVTAAGASASLSSLDSLYTAGAVDVSGRTASFNREVSVRMPSELVWLSASSVTVAVEIGPVIGSRTFTDVPVTFVGGEEGTAVYADTYTVDVTLSEAEMPWLNSLTSDSLQVTCDVSGLALGAYQLPLVCDIPSAAAQSYLVSVQPERLTVEVE